MYVLNVDTLRTAVRKRGFRGIKPFLKHLGLHRNTLDRFVKGASVLPSSIEQVLSALNISIEDALVQSSQNPADPVMSLAEEIHRKYPKTSLFLFGSRARGGGRKHSDFDIGVYSREGLPLKDFLHILEDKELFEEESPWRVDCVNLTNASDDFVASIAPDMKLLAGYDRDRVELLKRARHDHHEQK